jgi:type IV secretory pathway VirJ component
MSGSFLDSPQSSCRSNPGRPPNGRRLAALLLGALITGVASTAVAAAPQSSAATRGGIVEDSLHVAPFGPVHLYREGAEPAQVVLFASGDGGWNLGVVDMARSLAGMDAAVAGFSLPAYLKALGAEGGDCAYPAADLENLSKIIQKHLGLAEYRVPILVGYSSGATLVYTVLVQAPPTTFRGGISLGFCPDLEFKKILCRGSGLEGTPLPKRNGFLYKSAGTLEVPWIAFQGEVDQVCDAESTAAFVHRVRNGELVLLPKVGHGYAVEANWMPQFKESFRKIAAAPSADAAAKKVEGLADLPLEIVAADPAAAPGGNILVLHLTGDGGWGVTDRGLAREFAARGIPVIGLNSLHYFWKARTPDETSADVVRVLRYFLQEWNKNRVVLVGYSFGADVLPFVVNRLPQDLRDRIALVVYLGLSAEADFEFHVGSWVGARSGHALPVHPEVAKLRGVPMLCVYGRKEGDTICRDLDTTLVQPVELEGGHRIGSNFQGIVQEVLGRLGLPR